MKLPASRHGFTIVELVVVFGILGVLLTITLIAINPSEQFEKSRDTRRRSDVDNIASAIQQYIADHKGVFPVTIPDTAEPISSSGIDICSTLVPAYISALPQDPSSNNGAKIQASQCSSYDTEYTIRYSNDFIRIDAPSTEGNNPIFSIR